jgi:hypothetical protein
MPLAHEQTVRTEIAEEQDVRGNRGQRNPSADSKSPVRNEKQQGRKAQKDGDQGRRNTAKTSKPSLPFSAE